MFNISDFILFIKEIKEDYKKLKITEEKLDLKKRIRITLTEHLKRKRPAFPIITSNLRRLEDTNTDLILKEPQASSLYEINIEESLIEKVDENSLLEETRLPLEILTVTLYWEILDLTKERLNDSGIKNKDIDRISLTKSEKQDAESPKGVYRGRAEDVDYNDKFILRKENIPSRLFDIILSPDILKLLMVTDELDIQLLTSYIQEYLIRYEPNFYKIQLEFLDFLKQLHTLSTSLLLSLLKQDDLCMNESEIFYNVLRWCFVQKY
ncbi:hypothetical protein C1645_820262 [Glomus cerebriforme]|uniref:BACK domain-containing protein n=1 Tax=Glomus cerebriforme TaxID=658196 RepID=A0A397T778_9GLOM|nr:hypothetical protein C1645_820262 [Glomus cerebriforme]